MLLWPCFTAVVAQPFADNSVLNEGTWYKIGVTQDGVHRLDANFLNSLGINTSSIDPRNLRLYGNGGGMLPQRNSDPRHDDLVENAILVTGEGDGSFNSGDEVIFYGQGPHQWLYGTAETPASHRYNHYSDTNFYFLTVAPSPGKRIAAAPVLTGTAEAAALSTGFRYHERDLSNPLRSGRNWLGELFDFETQRSVTFALTDADPDGELRLRLRLAARADVTTRFSIAVAGETVTNVTLSQTNIFRKEFRHYQFREVSLTVPIAETNYTDSVRVTLTFDKAGSTRSQGWLDWIELDYDQRWDLENAPSREFFNLTTPTAGSIYEVALENGSDQYRIWDLSNPLEPLAINYDLNGKTLTYRADRVPGHFIAFREANLTPVSGREIPNQNLHGMSPVDYLILTHPNFRAEAERLADFHREHYLRSVAVVYPGDIYNEFSSGRQDVAAIRDFIRMHWLRGSGLTPGHVLLFGDGTYIYKDVNDNLNNDTNFLPTYQSRDSWDPTDSYPSDDFFVMMEPNEGYWGESAGIDGDNTYEVNTLDIPIGRLPIENVEQARQIVDKIIAYAKDPAGFGDWRSRIVLVGDYKDGEGTTHVSQSNGYTSVIENNSPCMNIDKIFIDNYPVVKTGSELKFPAARKDLLDALDEGSLILNYTGHGSERAWSNSTILEVSDLGGMQNVRRNPAVVTATCEFGRYDDPEIRSGAEIMTMLPQVGAIALFTTARLVYSSPNRNLNRNFYQQVFRYDSLAARMPTLGEIMMRTKNATFPGSPLDNINSRNFTLMGDPGIILNYPELRATISELNGEPVDPAGIDTLQSLARVSIRGRVENQQGQVQNNFAGQAQVTVFDKPANFTTRLSNYNFSWRNNRLFNGRASVSNGEFFAEFVMPIDVSYEQGLGKISVYLQNDSIDGAGCYTRLFVGGTDTTATSDREGPVVELYMNDTTWRDGGITSPNPDIFAVLADESGINTAGGSIGHEITAVLDEDVANTLILNNYYSAEVDNFQRGVVRYPLRELENGLHTLRLRVWDAANNISEATTSFVVADDARIALEEILNFPNPFTDQTTFSISHNQDGQEMEVKVEVMGLDGRKVRELNASFFATGNRYEALTWDGTNGQGNPLSAGMYLYRVSLRNPASGQETQATERLVLLR